MPLIGRNKSGKHLNPNPSRARAFISYSQKDRKKIDFLRDQKKLGYLNFIDYSIKKAYTFLWKRSAEYRIKNSDVVLVPVSENTHESKSVKYEMELAEKYGKPVIPFHLSPSNTSKTINGKMIHSWKCDEIQKLIDRAKKKR